MKKKKRRNGGRKGGMELIYTLSWKGGVKRENTAALDMCATLHVCLDAHMYH